MPLMIKLNRNIMKVDLCLDNGHFITVFSIYSLCISILIIFLMLFNVNKVRVMYEK